MDENKFEEFMHELKQLSFASQFYDWEMAEDHIRGVLTHDCKEFQLAKEEKDVDYELEILWEEVSDTCMGFDVKKLGADNQESDEAMLEIENLFKTFVRDTFSSSQNPQHDVECLTYDIAMDPSTLCTVIVFQGLKSESESLLLNQQEMVNLLNKNAVKIIPLRQ